MSSVAEKGLVVLLGFLLALYAVLPGVVGRAFAPVGTALGASLNTAAAALPRVAFLVLVLVGVLVVVVAVAVSVARVGYDVLQNAGPRAQRAFGFVTPSTPIGKMAVGAGFVTLFLLGSVWSLPYVIGSLSEGSAVSGADDLAGQAAATDPVSLSAADVEAGRPSGGSSADAEAYERPTPDADGDRLKDAWEAAGETPDGVPLPDADPRRKDLYVQVNYGGGTVPLSEAEKRQLERVWAEMPVENPDGSTGVDVHIVDQRPRGGPLGTTAATDVSSYDEVVQFYTEQHVGDRACRYHQVVFGSVDRPDTDGVATTPGYAVVVDGDRREDGGDPSPRVVVITHELLHNVVGEHTQSGHTSRGWLSAETSRDDTFLSERTATHLSENGFAGSGYFQRELC